VIPRGYADPGRMLVESFIPFRISPFPLKTIIENGKRETGNEKVTNRIDAPFYGQANATSPRLGWLLDCGDHSCFTGIPAGSYRDLAVAFNSQAMLIPSVFIVWMPSESFSTSPGVLPMPKFQ